MNLSEFALTYYHNVLDLHERHDIHDKEIPWSLDAVAVELLKTTQDQFNVEYDILSFVKGEGGVRYVKPRIESIARFLRREGITVRHAELCYERAGVGGKAEWCYRNKCHAILDDTAEIIRDCRDVAGIFTSQVYPKSGSIRDAVFALRAKLQQCSHAEFLGKFAPR